MVVHPHLDLGAQPLDIRKTGHDPQRGIRVLETPSVLPPEVGVHRLGPRFREGGVRVRDEADLSAELVERVHWDQEIEALDGLVALQRGRDKGRGADHLAPEIERRPTAVSPGDGRIRLDHPAVVDVGLEPGDPPHRHRGLQS